MSEPAPKKPEVALRRRNVRISIWENRAERGDDEIIRLSASIRKRYRDEEGKWHDTDVWFVEDLLRLAELAREAAKLMEQREDQPPRRGCREAWHQRSGTRLRDRRNAVLILCALLPKPARLPGRRASFWAGPATTNPEQLRLFSREPTYVIAFCRAASLCRASARAAVTSSPNCSSDRLRSPTCDAIPFGRPSRVTRRLLKRAFALRFLPLFAVFFAVFLFFAPCVADRCRARWAFIVNVRSHRGHFNLLFAMMGLLLFVCDAQTAPVRAHAQSLPQMRQLGKVNSVGNSTPGIVERRARKGLDNVSCPPRLNALRQR
jgi:hypothetical protein